jgi:hypothetical protein
MMPDDCSYIVSGIAGLPGWFGVFRNLKMKDTTFVHSGTLYQLCAWSGKEFVQTERIGPAKGVNCWPSVSEALMVLSDILAGVVKR